MTKLSPLFPHWILFSLICSALFSCKLMEQAPSDWPQVNRAAIQLISEVIYWISATGRLELAELIQRGRSMLELWDIHSKVLNRWDWNATFLRCSYMKFFSCCLTDWLKTSQDNQIKSSKYCKCGFTDENAMKKKCVTPFLETSYDIFWLKL